MKKVKQVQQQDTHIKDRYYIFYAIMVPQMLQPDILYENMYNFIKRNYYWRKLHQPCNKFVRSCPECQQVTLKEPSHVELHPPIPQFPMSFISMDILGQYHVTKMETNKPCHMHIDYVIVIPIKLKNIEEVIKA